MPTSAITSRTGLRLWAPSIAMLLLSLLSYVDRSVLAVLSPTILADLHLTATQYSWAITAFSLCYMVANPLWGIWADRAGTFRVALVAVALWSFASGSHALVYGFAGLCLARAVLGFGEGATFPTGMKTIDDTLPATHRGTGLAISASGGSLGAAITPLIVVPVAARFGWRAAFGFSMLAGLAWILLWVFLRSTLRAAPATEYVPPAALPWKHRLNRDLWASCALYAFGGAPIAYGLYAAPLYLSRVLHVSQASLGHLLWLPPLGWEIGYIVWGRLSDWRHRRGLHNPFRLAVITACGALSFPAIALSAHLPHPVALSMLGFFLGMFFVGGSIILALADGLPRQPKGSAGFLSGFCISGWALATGILMPVLGRLFDAGHYAASLCAIAFVPMLGVILWRLLRTPALAGSAPPAPSN